MLHLLSEVAYSDLHNISTVRNLFAHQPEIETFDAQTVHDTYKNLKLVDIHAFEIVREPNGRIQLPPATLLPMFGYSEHSELIGTPRFRYIFTAQILCNRLGQAAINPTVDAPFV